MYKYVITGDPLFREGANRRGPGSVWKAKHANYAVTLESQGCPLPVLIGPVYVKIHFYLSPKSKLLHQRKNACFFYSASSPSLLGMADIICDLMVGTVINKKVSVAKLDIEKTYSNEPRTEIQVERLGSYGQKSDKE